MLCVWGWGRTSRLVLKARVVCVGGGGDTEQKQKKILHFSVSITHLNAHVRQYKVPHLKASVVSGKGQIRSHLLRDYCCIYSNMSSATVIAGWRWQQGSAKHRQNTQRIQICRDILRFLLIPPLHFRRSRLILKSYENPIKFALTLTLKKKQISEKLQEKYN